MVEYMLGNYLVETGKITKEQLIDVINKQDSVRVKLGLLAVSEGLMTTQQAEEVGLMQAEQDKRFGDIAVDLGYLTQDQVARLLKKQGGAYLSFMQNLMDEDLIDMDEIDLVVNDFKNAFNYSHSDFEAIKSDEVERILPLLLPETALQYQALISMVVRTLIRLIDRHMYLGQAVMVDDLPEEGIALQKVEGQDGFLDCFSERNGALLKMCTIYGQEEFAALDADALDAAAELLNCSNGMYVAEVAKDGRDLELMPPEYATVKEVQDICRIPVFIGNKGLYFMVGRLR